ncbi:hypothetical protein C0992_001469 [Termitomyces sp. T32_za158]|nr:hypothetical protein C0992_001469 [Termitomyces sp. T32_za158]
MRLIYHAFVQVVQDGNQARAQSSEEQLEAREMVFKHTLQEKRDEIDVLKEKSGSKAQEASLKQSLKEKTDEAEVAKKEGRTKEAELHKAEVKVVALLEQLKAQEAALKQTQGRYGDLQKASATLAADLTSAQNALEGARQEVLQRAQDSTRLAKLFDYIEADRVKAQDENLRRATEEEHVRAENERVTELVLIVERLEDEKRVLLERSGRLKERYDRNELNDDEKDFADWLMSLSSSLHEEEEVAKDNELRRKINLVNQLQGKIRELESSLARLIKEKEELSGGATNSMIDVDAFMTSSPNPNPIEASRPPGRTVPVDGNVAHSVQPSPAKVTPPLTKPLDLAAAHALTKQAPVSSNTPKTLATKKLIGLSFSSLDESDSEEDIPLSEVSASTKSVLGKRDRVPSPSQFRSSAQQSVQTNANLNLKTYTGSHRLRNGAANLRTNTSSAQLSSTGQKKTVDSGIKLKRKRK